MSAQLPAPVQPEPPTGGRILFQRQVAFWLGGLVIFILLVWKDSKLDTELTSSHFSCAALYTSKS